MSTLYSVQLLKYLAKYIYPLLPCMALRRLRGLSPLCRQTLTCISAGLAYLKNRTDHSDLNGCIATCKALFVHVDYGFTDLHWW